MPSPDWGGLIDALRTGEISRRAFVRRATAAGISIGAASLLANQMAAQSASPEASPAGASPAATDPSVTGAAQPGGRSINREEYHRLIRGTFDLSEPAITGGQVIFGASSDIDTLNPHLIFDVFSGWVSSCIYEGLVVSNPTNGFPAPGLADYWELSVDGRTYTFHLNPNATWHDGEPVTTDDVVFSFDAALDESGLSGIQFTVDLVLDSYRAVDVHTFELVAKSPLAVFVENTAALIGIVPKHIWEAVPPSDWGSDPGSTGQDPARVIGSGPFRFVEWVAEDHITLARNEDYWDRESVPSIDEFIFRVMPEASNRTAALTSGEIDFARIPVSEAKTLGEDPGLAVVAYDDTGWILLNINQNPDETGLFVDIPVRQALMYALDRQLIVDEIYLGYAVRADGTQAPLSVAYAPERIDTIYDYDPDKARQLLEEAGWVDEDGDGTREKDGVRFSFECLYADTLPTNQQMLPYIQQAWGEVGIEMQPVPMPLQVLFDALGEGEYDMATHGISWGVDGSQGDMFRCDAVPPAGFNEMHYCNERYHELDALQMRELDVDKRVDLLIEQSNILNDEVAAGVLVFPQSLVGYRQALRNFLPNGYGFLWSMPWWWIEAQ
jgi:peptide/nickel transport system substrate-binding protein